MRSIAYAGRRLFSNPINTVLFVLGAFILIVGLLPQITALLPHQVPQIGQVVGALTILAGVAKPLRDTAAQAAAAKDKAEADAENSPASQANARSVVQTLVKRTVDEARETPLGSHLQLGLMSRPDYIDDPTPAGIGRPAAAPGPVAPDTSIAGVFDESAGRLLILGEGGAGKSGLLVEIAAGLLAASLQKEDQPVPVVLRLTALPEEPFGFDDWLALQINDTYGISQRMAKGWVDTAKVVVLLDGLGTLGDRMTERAVDAINLFTKANPLPMAITARLEEYLAPKKKLRFHSAVVIQPLTDKQIDDCLSIPEMAGVRQAVSGDAGLRELLKTPWMLGIVFKAYRNKEAGAMPTGGAPGEMRDAILAEYVFDCLNRQRDAKEAAFKPELARRWLDWLARQLVSRKQEVFF